jgi:hypothetical protein
MFLVACDGLFSRAGQVNSGMPESGALRRTGKMTQQTTVSQPPAGGLAAGAGAAPAAALGLTGALLAVAVAAVHVADQDGVTALAEPAWLGWGYRAIEVGGLLTALTLLLAVAAGRALARLGWAAALLLAAAPLLGYLATRTIGLPEATDDVGNWGDWVGTVSLLLEGGLAVLSVSMLRALRARPAARP